MSEQRYILLILTIMIFGLKHPFDDFGSKGFSYGDDWYNIMDYPKIITEKSKRQLRAYQVIYIEKFK